MDSPIIGVRDVRAVNVGTLVGSSCTVSAAVYDRGVLDVAAQYVDHSLRDYVLFQLSDDFYCIMFADNCTVFPGSYSLSGNIECFVIQAVTTTTTTTANRSFSGSGSFAAADPGNSGTGSFSGSYQDAVYKDTTNFFVYPLSLDQYTIYTDNYLTYTSFAGAAAPDLREGVLSYAFAAFLCFFAVCAFWFADRVLRRVY